MFPLGVQMVFGLKTTRFNKPFDGKSTKSANDASDNPFYNFILLTSIFLLLKLYYSLGIVVTWLSSNSLI